MFLKWYMRVVEREGEQDYKMNVCIRELDLGNGI